MIQGTTLDNLVASVIRDAQDRKDFIVNTADLKMGSESNRIAMRGRDNVAVVFDPTDHAHGQIAQSAGIPGGFYTRLRESYPAELAQVVNAIWHKDPSNRMLRTLRGNLRAFPSDKYRRIDNDKVLAQVLPVVRERGYEIKSCQVTDERLYLHIVSARIQGEVRVGDVVQSGFLLTNSEIGMGSFTMTEMDFRLACLNGMVHPGKQVRRHVGARQELSTLSYEELAHDTQEATDKALYLQLRDEIDRLTSPATFQARLERLKAAADTSVVERGVSPVDTMKSVAKSLELSQEEHTAALTSFLTANDFTRWGLANAITSVANEHPRYDRAVELEAVGGRIMAMPTRDLWEMVEVGRA